MGTRELKRDGTYVWWDYTKDTSTYCPRCLADTGQEQDLSPCCMIPVNRKHSSIPDDDD